MSYKVLTHEQMNAICYLRDKFGYTQNKIANFMNISQASVAHTLKLRMLAELGERLSFEQYVSDRRIGGNMEEWARQYFKPWRVKPRIHAQEV